MGFGSFAKIGQAVEESGKVHYQYVTKATFPSTGTAGRFVDLNQTSGQPKYNAFAGTQLGFTPLEGSGNAGVYVGPTISGSTKHLLRLQVLNINTAANTIPPNHIILSDYLGFYPLIDCDDVDVQAMDNTQSLTRYTDGAGVQVALIVQAPMTATAPLTITYTNSDGVTGRTSTHNVVAGANIGVCATAAESGGAAGAVTPFFPLAGNDAGVRSIESVQFSSSAGGFICLALVKPIATIMVLESAVPVEKHFGFENQMLPEIKSGAYLNFIVKHPGTGAGSLRAELVFVNS